MPMSVKRRLRAPAPAPSATAESRIEGTTGRSTRPTSTAADREIGTPAIATPYHFGSAGVMTLIISHRGEVWEANVGSDTFRLAAGIMAFNAGAA
jgi:hypothetical protein